MYIAGDLITALVLTVYILFIKVDTDDTEEVENRVRKEKRSYLGYLHEGLKPLRNTLREWRSLSFPPYKECANYKYTRMLI